MIIRPDQMAVLGETQHRAFVRKMVRRLKQATPRQVEGMDDAAIADQVDVLCASAAAYGFRSERSVAIFIEVACYWGEGFEASPAFAPIRPLLNHPAGPPDAKADLLLQHHRLLCSEPGVAPPTAPVALP